MAAVENLDGRPSKEKHVGGTLGHHVFLKTTVEVKLLRVDFKRVVTTVIASAKHCLPQLLYVQLLDVFGLSVLTQELRCS